MEKPERFIRMPVVKERTGLSVSTIYNHIKNGTFPKQVSIGPRSAAWLESEIDAWMETRAKARKSA